MTGSRIWLQATGYLTCKDAQLVLSDWGEGEESAAGSSWSLERSADGMGRGRLPFASFRCFLPSLYLLTQVYPSQADITRETKVRKSGKLFFRKNRSVLR